jgi:hypothetical protein
MRGTLVSGVLSRGGIPGFAGGYFALVGSSLFLGRLVVLRLAELADSFTHRLPYLGQLADTENHHDNDQDYYQLKRAEPSCKWHGPYPPIFQIIKLNHIPKNQLRQWYGKDDSFITELAGEIGTL